MELCREWREWWNCNVALFEQQFLYKKDFELNKESHSPIWYVNPYITNYHGFSGSTQHTFIISQLLWSESGQGRAGSSAQDLIRLKQRCWLCVPYQKNWLEKLPIQVLTKFIPCGLLTEGPSSSWLSAGGCSGPTGCLPFPAIWGASKSVTFTTWPFTFLMPSAGLSHSSLLKLAQNWEVTSHLLCLS